jgi:hypothetical protein
MGTTKTNLDDVHQALVDLTRVLLATSDKFSTKSDAIRKLSELSIPPARIAAIVAQPLSSVTSTLSKSRRKSANNSDSPAPNR